MTTSWQPIANTEFVDAPCARVDPELFFPTGINQAGQQAAIKICETQCHLKNKCTKLALSAPYPPEGVWGGVYYAWRYDGAEYGPWDKKEREEDNV